MVKLDYTIIIQVINFVVLIFILNQLLFKPILRVMEERKQLVDGAHAEIASLEQSILEKTEEYEKRLQQARRDGLADRDQSIEAGAEQARGIMSEAHGDVAKMIEAFKGEIAGEKERARGILREQTQTIATEITKKVLGGNIG